MQSHAYAHLIGPQFVFFFTLPLHDDDDDDDKSENKREKRILFIMDLAMICINPKIDATRPNVKHMRWKLKKQILFYCTSANPMPKKNINFIAFFFIKPFNYF